MQEINDLKNIVIQSLESKGILSQLRAQIRSSVFKIIEDQESKDSKNPAFFWENPLCQKIHDTEEGLLSIELMHEFFEFFRMDYTNNVFIHESNYKESFTRDMVKKKLHVNDNKNEQPLLLLIIKQLLGGLFTGSQAQDSTGENNDRGKLLALEQGANTGQSGLTKNSDVEPKKSSTEEAENDEAELRAEAEQNSREQDRALQYQQELQRHEEQEAQAQREQERREQLAAQKKQELAAQKKKEEVERAERAEKEAAKRRRQQEQEAQREMEALEDQQRQEMLEEELREQEELAAQQQQLPNDSGTQNLSQNKSDRDPISATGNNDSKVDLENFIEHGNLENQLYDSDLHNQNDGEIIDNSDLQHPLENSQKMPGHPQKESPDSPQNEDEVFDDDFDDLPVDIEEDIHGDGGYEYDPRQPMYEDDDNGQ
jgi:hypothetical protein